MNNEWWDLADSPRDVRTDPTARFAFSETPYSNLSEDVTTLMGFTQASTSTFSIQTEVQRPKPCRKQKSGRSGIDE